MPLVGRTPISEAASLDLNTEDWRREGEREVFATVTEEPALIPRNEPATSELAR